METFDTQSRIAVLENEVKNVAHKLEEMRGEQKEQYNCLVRKFDDITKRIAILERWRWMIFGGAIVVGYLLAHIRIERLF